MHQIWAEYPVINQALERIQAEMSRAVHVQHPEVTEKINAYIEAPGKYLRAGLVLLMATLHPEGQITADKYALAEAIETFHLATLIHDDVIDEADERRQIETIHRAYSNRIAIYAGDYLLTMALQLLRAGDVPQAIAERYEKTVGAILTGELNQLMNQHNTTMSFNRYLKQIRRKTALLFALSTYAGYYQPEDSERHYRKARLVGENLGTAFQLADDLLDYQQLARQAGKPYLQDFQQGIYTAPSLYLKARAPEQFQSFATRQTWSKQDQEALVAAITAVGGFADTRRLMYRFSTRAMKNIEQLPGEATVKAEIKHLLQLLQLLPDNA